MRLTVVQALPDSFQRALTNGKALVVAGPDPGLTHCGNQKRRISLPCLAECGSGVHGPLTVHGGERLLVNGALPEALRPEVVLTVGLPPMSKAIRHALAGLPHMHVDGQGWDMWGTLQGSCGPEALEATCPEDMASTWREAMRTMQGIHAHETVERLAGLGCADRHLVFVDRQPWTARDSSCQQRVRQVRAMVQFGGRLRAGLCHPRQPWCGGHRRLHLHRVGMACGQNPRAPCTHHLAHHRRRRVPLRRQRHVVFPFAEPGGPEDCRLQQRRRRHFPMAAWQNACRHV